MTGEEKERGLQREIEGSKVQRTVIFSTFLFHPFILFPLFSLSAYGTITKQIPTSH